MKIAIIGGHLPPALSIIDNLPKDTKVLFIGRKFALEGDKAESFEYKTIIRKRIPFAQITTGRLQRKFTGHTIPSLFKLPIGFFQSIFILKSFKPDVVLGFGSYVAIPVILAAYILRVPIVIHEQTLESGFANKFLARFATKVCISWDSSRKYFPEKKTVLTGLPMKKMENGSFGKLRRKMENGLPLIYITGGSLGSHFINTLVEGSIEKLLERFNVVHQTGDAQEYGDFQHLEKIKKTLPVSLQERYLLKKFINSYEVGNIFNHADLIIGRSGMGTVSEIILFQKIALLIPLPFSAANEQMQNAEFLRNFGTSEILIQKNLNSDKFLGKVLEMFKNIDDYKRNTHKLKGVIQKDAALKVIEVIENAKKKR